MNPPSPPWAASEPPIHGGTKLDGRVKTDHGEVWGHDDLSLAAAYPPPYPSAFPPVYTGAMKRRRTNASDIPPPLLAAMARTPRARPAKGGGTQKSENNYVAEMPPKARPGAKKGNRNAVTHGLYTVETRARHAAVKAMVSRANQLADAVLGKKRHD